MIVLLWNQTVCTCSCVHAPVWDTAASGSTCSWLCYLWFESNGRYFLTVITSAKQNHNETQGPSKWPLLVVSLKAHCTTCPHSLSCCSFWFWRFNMTSLPSCGVMHGLQIMAKSIEIHLEIEPCLEKTLALPDWPLVHLSFIFLLLLYSFSLFL